MSYPYKLTYSMNGEYHTESITTDMPILSKLVLDLLKRSLTERLVQEGTPVDNVIGLELLCWIPLEVAA